ncbi:hypothetical protein CaCOL14_009651 [Colletotrichum acutatum]
MSEPNLGLGPPPTSTLIRNRIRLTFSPYQPVKPDYWHAA